MVVGGITRDGLQKIKEAICSVSTLALYDLGKPTLICADASSFGQCSSLFQKQSDESWRLVTFALRSMTDVEQRHAQIEKEALIITWICEKLAEYFVGLQFHIHTNHKPLIYLFSADKSLDAVPPHIQRFRLRMMRFSYSISYIPGTTLYTADALSRIPQRDVSSSVPDIDAFVAANVVAVPPLDAIIDDICAATTTDATLQQVLRHCQAGWPDVKNLSPDVLQFTHSRDHLTEYDGLVMYDACIVIPIALREKMMQALHDAHQGIVKMRKRERISL